MRKDYSALSFMMKIIVIFSLVSFSVLTLQHSKPNLARKKVQLFHNSETHQPRVCIYYHSEGDQRRPNFNTYNHVLCNNPKHCSPDCSFSHNKIEQLYHPSRYKSKFCQTYQNKGSKGENGKFLQCNYRDFCSFAHVQQEITIQLIHLEDATPDFFMYLYKT